MDGVPTRGENLRKFHRIAKREYTAWEEQQQLRMSHGHL